MLDRVVQLFAEEDRDDRRRSFVGAESVVVAGRSDGDSHQLRITVHRFDNCGQERQELIIFFRLSARLQQVFACISAHRPVVVLARTVDAFKGFFMKQTCQIVAVGDFLHEFHDELVVVDSLIRCREDRSQFVLSRRDFVMTRLRRDADSPELSVKVAHVAADTASDLAEVVIFKLLSLRGRRTEQCAAGQDQVLSLLIHVAFDEEVFLFRSDSRRDLADVILAEELQDSDRFVGQRLHRTQQRRLFVQHFAGVGYEGCRNVQRRPFYKGKRGRVPGCIAAGFECRSQSAGRERGSIRFALYEFLA